MGNCCVRGGLFNSIDFVNKIIFNYLLGRYKEYGIKCFEKDLM